MDKQITKIIGLIVILLLAADVYLFSLLSGTLSFIFIITQVFSGFYGIWRLKSMELGLLFLVEAELGKNNPIVREVWDEVIKIVACVCLLMPGILSDFVGILMLQSGVRKWFVDTTFYSAL